MAYRQVSSDHLAEHHIQDWIQSQVTGSSPGEEKRVQFSVPEGSVNMEHVNSFERNTPDSCKLSVFCIDGHILLLTVSGSIRELDAKELIGMFRDSNPFKSENRPEVILDFSQVTHVAYGARKRILLAVHILRNKSKRIWIIESGPVKSLMDMHEKMYPSVNRQLLHCDSLIQAIQQSLTDQTRLQISGSMDSKQQQHTEVPVSKETTEQLRKLEQLRAILNSAPDPIFSLSTDGKIRDTNDAGKIFVTNTLNQHFELELDFHTIWEFTDRSHWQRILQQVSDGIPWEEHVSIITLQKHYQINLTPVNAITDGEKTFSLFVRDISRTKAVEEESRYQRELIDSISYSIQEGLFRSSPQKGIMFVNKAFVEMFGYDSEEEVKKLDPYELYVDTSRRDDFVKIVRDQKSFINEEVHFKRKDGSTFWGLISSVKKTENDLTYHDGAIRDVTQLREAQLTLKEKNYLLMQINDELKKVNSELDGFVYRVSHDLRAPLVSLLGLVSIFRLEKDLEKKNRYLDLMEKSVERLDNFILDIMNYSRNSRIKISSEEIALRTLVADTIESLRFSQDGSFKIKNLIDDRLKIRTDSQRLRPILNNLLSNAIRYRDLGKDEQFVTIQAELINDGVKIEVSDNGIGIPKEHQKDIFKMFFRASKQSEGSGIGLYIVKETVEKLHGTVNLFSTEGIGTTFSIFLPNNPIQFEREGI